MRPPLLITFLAVVLIALATAGGAVMSAFRVPIQRYATERILAAPETHNLSGSRAYDLDAAGEIVFTIEAGLSFFHTHGEGMGLVLLFASTAVSYLVRRRGFRNGLNTILGISFLFPIGYLAYSFFTLLYGKDRGAAGQAGPSSLGVPSRSGQPRTASGCTSSIGGSPFRTRTSRAS